MFKKSVIKSYNLIFNHRETNKIYLKYFTAKDYNLLTKPVSFKSLENTLNGYLFYDKDLESYKDLIVFAHGMGGGYESYMTEIANLVNNNFLVLAYDATGTNSSEGKSLVGFSQSIIDLKSALDYVFNDPFLKTLNINLFGHSWGAFSVLNVLHYDYDIKKVVALAPFISVKELFKQNMTGIKRLALKEVLKHEHKLFGDISKFSAIDVLNKNTDIFVMHSFDDSTVSYNNFKLLKEHNTKDTNEFITVYNHLHLPMYDVSSSHYLNDKLISFNNYLKNNRDVKEEDMINFFKNFDFKKAVKQDTKSWELILSFLRR